MTLNDHIREEEAKIEMLDGGDSHKLHNFQIMMTAFITARRSTIAFEKN